MRFKGVLVITFIAFLCCPFTQVRAGSFTDDFNDGNADGWLFPYYPGHGQGAGQWSVEDGVLVQSFFGDGIVGLVENLVISDQVIETQARTYGDAGVVLWHQEVNDYVSSYVSVSHGYQTGMTVLEYFNGTFQSYSYGGPWIGSDTWYGLTVDADSTTGHLAVSVVYPDGVYSFTHHAGTTYRLGRSGLYSGNWFGYFDNFRLTSDDIAPVPEPSTMLLLASGLVGLAGWRKFMRRLSSLTT